MDMKIIDCILVNSLPATCNTEHFVVWINNELNEWITDLNRATSVMINLIVAC